MTSFMAGTSLLLSQVPVMLLLVAEQLIGQEFLWDLSRWFLMSYVPEKVIGQA